MTPREFISTSLRRLQKPAINAALVLGSLSLAVVFAEAGVRLAAPQQLILIRPDLWQPADTVGWLHRPNVSTRINTGERTVTVFTDAAGFRVSAEGPSPADRQILLLGDSFMEALQVEYEQSGAGLLEAALASNVDEHVAVRNAGIGGWDPDQYLLRARSLLAQDDYELVVTAVYLGNDLIERRRDYLPPRAPAERARFRLPRALSWREFTNAVLRPVNDFLEVRSHLFLLVRNQLQTMRMAMGLAPLTFPPQFLISDTGSARWEVTARLCEEINDLAAEYGADALFVLIPTPFQVDSMDLMQYVRGYDLDLGAIDLEQPNRRLGEDLEARGLNVYDLLPHFRSAHAGGQRLFGEVDMHFTPAGNRLFADLVAPVVADLIADGATRRATPTPTPE